MVTLGPHKSTAPADLPQTVSRLTNDARNCVSTWKAFLLLKMQIGLAKQPY